MCFPLNVSKTEVEQILPVAPEILFVMKVLLNMERIC